MWTEDAFALALGIFASPVNKLSYLRQNCCFNLVSTLLAVRSGHPGCHGSSVTVSISVELKIYLPICNPSENASGNLCLGNTSNFQKSLSFGTRERFTVHSVRFKVHAR